MSLHLRRNPLTQPPFAQTSPRTPVNALCAGQSTTPAPNRSPRRSLRSTCRTKTRSRAASSTVRSLASRRNEVRSDLRSFSPRRWPRRLALHPRPGPRRRLPPPAIAADSHVAACPPLWRPEPSSVPVRSVARLCAIIADPFASRSIVKNDTVSRAIVKGVLDGDLLTAFEMLPLERQVELAEAVGTDADTVLANLRNLRGFE